MAEEKKGIPALMRAVVFDRYAANNDEIQQVLRFAPEWKVPQPASKQVLVKVHAASINPVDYKMLKGLIAFLRPSPPTTVGFDLSGEVVAVGSGCKRLAVGDKVFGATALNEQGSFAEYIAVSEDKVSKKPDSITHAEAAALPVAANTAVQAFLDTAKLKKGERVLVLAGAGGTGHVGIQLAKFWGASHVSATCSPHSNDFLKGLGADECIDYHNTKWAEGRSNSFDVVYDCVGGKEAWDDAVAVLKPGTGRFLTIVGDKGNADATAGSVFKTVGGLINRKFWSNFNNPEYHLVMVQHKYQTTDRVAEAVKAGALKPFISKTYKLEQFKELFADIMSSRTRGKLVIDVSGQADTK